MAVFRSSSPHTIIQKARSEIFHTVLAQVHTHFLHVLPLTDQGRQYTADNAIPVFYKTHKSLQFLTLLFGLLQSEYYIPHHKYPSAPLHGRLCQMSARHFYCGDTYHGFLLFRRQTVQPGNDFP